MTGRRRPLSLAGTYATGGLGGQLTGSVVDHVASQGALTYDRATECSLRSTPAATRCPSSRSRRPPHPASGCGSGGEFPVSVAIHGNVVYVLNAENGGLRPGLRSLFDHLFALPGSTDLGLDPTATPQFVNTPGPGGLLARRPAVDRDDEGQRQRHRRVPRRLVRPALGPAGGERRTGRGAVRDPLRRGGAPRHRRGRNEPFATFTLNPGGTVTPISAVGTGQAATCWVAQAQGFFYASNAGSAAVTQYTETPNGALGLANQTGTDPGTVDAAASGNGQYLYVQTGGNGIVDAFRVGPNGTLASIGSVTVAGAIGGEGIVAL